MKKIDGNENPMGRYVLTTCLTYEHVAKVDPLLLTQRVGSNPSTNWYLFVPVLIDVNLPFTGIYAYNTIYSILNLIPCNTP